MPKREFWHLRVPIVTMALGLVLFTVAGVGWFIHWMIPSIPLAVAFALAGVLSPTDAVAVSALTGRMEMPSRLMHVLEGEAMMNDASGLVAFKFALAATTTGAF
jgi:CPA1 family monovalent cation:H+ antiporter